MVEPISIEFQTGEYQQKYLSPEGKTQIHIGRAQDGVHIDLDLWRDELVVGEQLCISHSLSTWWVETTKNQANVELAGRKFSGKSELFPNDQLRIGNTRISVHFKSNHDVLSASGRFDTELPVNETEPPQGISEDNRISVLARVSEIVALHRGQRAILQALMMELRNAFPTSERQTIALTKDTELLPVAFHPRPRSTMSYTLARKAITEQQAIHWTSDEETSYSLKGTTSAIYAPIFCAGIVVGVTQVDTTNTSTKFGEHDLKMLSVIANTIGFAVISDDEILNKLPRVFLSYAHLDSEVCFKMARDLRRHQIAVWYDERLKPGESWRKQLAETIQSVDVFVLLMTPNSIASVTCQWELEVALQSKRLILPLMVKKCEPPVTIASLQYLPMDDDLYTTNITNAADRIRDLKDMGS